MTVIRRLLFVPAFLLFVLSIIPLLLFSLFTWIVTGNNLDDQLDWYIDQGEKLHDWAGGKNHDFYPY